MDSTVVAMPSPVDPPAPGPMWSQHRLPVAIPRAERAFIPADTAKKQVSNLVEQMGQIKASHERAISQLEASFAEAESRTRAHYTDVIRNLKQQANEKLIAKRAELAALNNQLEEQKAEHARLVAEQDVKSQEAAAALQQMQQAADESLRTANEAHNEAMSQKDQAHSAAAAELQATIDTYAASIATLEREIAAATHQLDMREQRIHALTAQRNKIATQLQSTVAEVESLTSELDSTKQQLERANLDLSTARAANTETAAALEAAAEARRKADEDHAATQQALRDKEAAMAQAEADAASRTEQETAAKVKAADERVIEQAAQAAASRPATPDTQTEGVVPVPVPVPVTTTQSRPETADAGVMTDVSGPISEGGAAVPAVISKNGGDDRASAEALAEQEALVTQLRADMQHAENRLADKEQELEALRSELRAAEAQTQALLAADEEEGGGEGQADEEDSAKADSQEETPAREEGGDIDVVARAAAESRLEMARQAKADADGEMREAKIDIKEWVTVFQEKNGRKPEKADKKTVKEKYLRYRRAEQSIEAADKELAEAQAELDSLLSAGAATAVIAAATTEAAKPKEEGGAGSRPSSASVQRIKKLEKQVARLKSGLATQEAVVAAKFESKIASLESQLREAKQRAVGAEENLQQVTTTNNLATILERCVVSVSGVVEMGKVMWDDGRQDDTVTLYLKEGHDVVDQLPPTTGALKMDLQKAAFDAERCVIAEPTKAALMIRQALDAFIQQANAMIEELKGETEATTAATGAGVVGADSEEANRLRAEVDKLKRDLKAARSSDGTASGSPDQADSEQVAELQARIEELEAEVESLREAAENADDGSDDKPTGRSKPTASRKSDAAKPTGKAAAAGAGGASAAKVKQMDATIKELRTKLRTAQKEADQAKLVVGAAGKDKDREMAVMQRKLVEAEKTGQKALAQAKKESDRALASVEKQLATAQSELTAARDELAALKAANADLTAKTGDMAAMTAELAELRESAKELSEAKAAHRAADARREELEKLYKDEQLLRKKYWNMMEDMKGKIRVFARCRPMAASELKRGCHSVVQFPDEVTLQLHTHKGEERSFVYDSVFGPNSTQDQVFEDTENLVQSAFDGFNVCIFAYGQTGSGKTWTMTGSPEQPGVIPRAISRLFQIIEGNAGAFETTVTAYMVELYNDNLVDLFLNAENKGNMGRAPKLDIKKDAKGMVMIKNAVVKEGPSAEVVMELFETGNKSRSVGSTKMNAESSRSHLIFGLLVTSFNKQTKRTSVGKLSLVDLAGSERVGKTGASADRLREAQSINKSLSALGDVIAALSSGESFIPYRNNKLTQLMSDSLGGNAKTLMFVCISPADYNDEETQTSLVYASRVKLITNNANKNSDSEEVARLKAIIRQLKAEGAGGGGGGGEDEDDGDEE